MKTTFKSDEDIFGKELNNALIDFRNTYKDITSGDLQTFIMGWNTAINCLNPKS